MKRVNLFTQFYYDQNPERRNELEYCLLHNLHNDFSRVIIFMTEHDYENYFKLLDKENPIPEIFVKFVEDRPTFNTYFEEMNDAIYSDQINIIGNSDLFFTYHLTDIREYMSKLDNHTCVALSRYDYDPEHGVTPFHRADSQDTWIFNDCPEIKTELEFGQGEAGCISGDAIIKYNRGKRNGGRPISLQDLYIKFNNIPSKKRPFYCDKTKTQVLSYDILNNRLEYRPIKKVIQSGVKETITIKFEDGISLQLTKDHKILDIHGEYKEAQKFNVGDFVVSANKQKAVKIKEKKQNRKRIVVYVKHHPFAENKVVRGYKYKRVKRCRLVLEANLNHLKYDEFLEILRNDKSRAEKLKYYDPKLEVHHKNMDTTCDDLDNLEIVDKSTHAKYHANQDNFNFIPVVNNRIVSIEDSGSVMTYDIEMESEPHNFVVNNIIVHNCDNRLAYEIINHGYNIINPCSSIITYHLHTSNVRNYLNEQNEPKKRIPPPYHLITPQ